MDDLRELLELLARHNVEFLVIGAHALAHHGYPRATKDIDLWVHNDAENAQRMATALEEFGAAIGPEGIKRFNGEAWRMIRLGVPPHMVDLLNFAAGQAFEEVWSGRVHGELLGVSVHFPSRIALIEMKRATGRAQDLLDVAKLEETGS